MTDEMKAAVTVSEMARMLGMSRSRFYQLMGSTFPSPIRDDNGRPYFDEEGQRTCLEVRHRRQANPLLCAPQLDHASVPTS